MPSKTLIPGPPRAGQIWLDILIATTAFLWLAAIVLLVTTWITHNWHLAVGALSAVVAAGALSVVSCVLAAANGAQQRVAEGQRRSVQCLEEQIAEHRAAVESYVDEQMAAVLAELQKLHHRNTDMLRRQTAAVEAMARHLPAALKNEHWQGYSDGVEDAGATGGDTSNVRSLSPRRREEGARPGSGGYGG